MKKVLTCLLIFGVLSISQAVAQESTDSMPSSTELSLDDSNSVTAVDSTAVAADSNAVVSDVSDETLVEEAVMPEDPSFTQVLKKYFKTSGALFHHLKILKMKMLKKLKTFGESLVVKLN